jgi:hypothetical protein
MKFTVTSRTSTIVAVAVGCGLWVVPSPARSEEWMREPQGCVGTTDHKCDPQAWALRYMLAVATRGWKISESDRGELEAILGEGSAVGGGTSYGGGDSRGTGDGRAIRGMHGEATSTLSFARPGLREWEGRAASSGVLWGRWRSSAWLWPAHPDRSGRGAIHTWDTP